MPGKIAEALAVARGEGIDQRIRHVPGLNLRRAEMLRQIPIELNVHFIGIEALIGDAVFRVFIQHLLHVIQRVGREIILLRRLVFR